MKIKDKEEIALCPLRKAAQIFGGKWNMIIIQAIGNEEVRFGEIKKFIPDISEKVLIEKLKELNERGILERKDYQEVPPKVSYQLSENGIKALELIIQVETFGKELD